MKAFLDGDAWCITLDDFVDLQESAAVFVPCDSDDGRALARGGIGELPLARVRDLFYDLVLQKKGGGGRC